MAARAAGRASFSTDQRIMVARSAATSSVSATTSSPSVRNTALATSSDFEPQRR